MALIISSNDCISHRTACECRIFKSCDVQQNSRSYAIYDLKWVEQKELHEEDDRNEDADSI